MKLLLKACIKFVLGLLIVGMLLFLPAGTFEYWNAWLLIGLLFVPMFFVGIVLFKKNPDLLEKRLNGKEKEQQQKTVIKLSIILFITGFILSGLDFKYGWSSLPMKSIVVGSVIVIISYGLYIEVMRENTYLSRNVEIQKNQKLVDTGLYGIVRHPMYMATSLLFLSFPIVLGSVYAFFLFLAFPFVLAKRIKNEEQILEEGLEGYKEYKQKVKYKMIPFIW